MTLVKMNNNLGRAHNSPLFDNRWTDEFFRPFFAERNQSSGNSVAANIGETSEAFLIDLATPGLSKEDFKISLEKDILTIKVAKEQSQDESKPNFHRVEFSYKSFERAFKLPKTVDQEAISAKYENGILSLTLPKKVEAQEKAVKEISIS